MNIIHEACDPELAKDKKLPYSAYLICYKDKDDVVKHDIAVSGTAVEIFDNYYDKYKKGFQWMKQSEGRVTPSLWNQQQNPEPPKKKPRKKRE